MALIAEERGGDEHKLIVTDLSTIGPEPTGDQLYKHRVRLVEPMRELWHRRDIVFTLAERDVRSSYKQAALGLLWALVTPVVQLVLFTVIFNHVKTFSVAKGLPYALFVFTGILCWSFFASSLNAGGNSIINNMQLVQKTHFPREAYPLSQMLEACFYSAIALVPFAILFYLHSFVPKPELVWLPIGALVELMFTAGVTLFFSAAIVYVRDLQQLMGIIIQLGMFATPVIWPFQKLPAHMAGLPIRDIYCVFNPLGPVIDNARRTLLLGQQPDWLTLGLGAAGAVVYLVSGYLIFKRLEATFADIA